MLKNSTVGAAIVMGAPVVRLAGAGPHTTQLIRHGEYSDLPRARRHDTTGPGGGIPAPGPPVCPPQDPRVTAARCHLRSSSLRASTISPPPLPPRPGQ